MKVLAAALAALFVLPVSVHSQVLTVDLRCREACSAAVPMPAEVTADRVGGNPAHVRKSVMVPTTGVVSLLTDAELGQIWRITAHAGKLWVAEKFVTITDGDNPVALNIYRASALSGQVSMTGKESPPRSLTVRFHSASESGEADCPLVAKKWRCSLPAGTWDLSIKSRGFISTHMWGIMLAPDGTVDAGSVVLRPGSSITGFVSFPRGVDSPSVVISARPERNGVPYAGSERVDRVAPSATPNPRGFFQIDGLAPGNYLVMARSGNLNSDVVRVRVLEGAEAELARPLPLKRPESLMLFVDPPTAPDGQRWRVSIRRADESAPPFETDLDVSGAIHLPRVVPGSYRLALTTSAGQWYNETIEVTPGTLPVQVQVPLVATRGTVRLGDRPLSGAITFGGEHGAVRITMRSDAAGKFQGFLPHDGEWSGEVTSVEQGVHSAPFETKVRRLDGADSAIVDISLPRTMVSGVVLLKGSPVEMALVTINSAGSIAQENTSHDGRFRFDAVAAGDAEIRAEWHGEYVTKPVSRHLVEGDEMRDVVLDLESADGIDGVVLSSGGPVPGAVVYAYSSSDSDPKISPTACSIDGRFHERLTPDSREANIYVTAIGFSFRALREPVGGDPVTINVQQDGGRLALDFSRPPFYDPVIFVGEVPVPYGILRVWSRANGASAGNDQHVILANLQPGRYTVCMPSGRASALALWAGQRTTQCTSGVLGSSSELRLSIPIEMSTPTDTRPR
jgi:hypothetical protein